MSGDALTWFWGVVGLVVAFGLAYFGIKTWSVKHKQKQTVDRGATGYQAGGDINISNKFNQPDERP
nr:hypothetical protein [Brevundimonas diminuta]